MTPPRKSVFCWLNPKLEVRKTPTLGLGMFAREKIAKHERMIFYGGHILPVSFEKQLGESFQDMSLQIDADFVIGIAARDEMEDACHFNHSCDPNAGFKGQIFLVAMREIESGEHITFDYAMCISQSAIADPYVLECKCGSPRCRGIISENDWQNPDIQRRYDGYFQWYLQEKIQSINRGQKEA